MVISLEIRAYNFRESFEQLEEDRKLHRNTEGGLNKNRWLGD